MLRQLTIENIALIQYLDLELNGGLTVITGETGAGKSILLGALGQVLGDRADVGLIRSGTEKAIVTGRFHPPADHPVWPWLGEQALEGEPGEILLRRVLSIHGRHRCYVNDRPVSLGTLQEAGRLLVDIHGQHDHQSLYHPAAHLAILDAFAGHDGLAAAVRALHGQWRSHSQALERLRGQARDAAERQAFLRFQWEELEQAAVEPGEMTRLEGRFKTLSNTRRLMEHAATGLALLSGDGRHDARSLLEQATRALESAARHDPSLEALAERLASLGYELEDVAGQLEQYQETLEQDPAELARISSRIDLIHQLCRKHRREPDELAPLAESWRQELESLDNLELNEAKLVRDTREAAAAYREQARQLGESRRQAARRLDQEVEAQLAGLYMERTRFQASLTPLEGPPRADGMEEVAFEVSTNPGEPLKPLRQVASGGEISRIMLALKTVLADVETVPSLIFDEVDVGVGGRVADAIGARLLRVAQARQVVTITHLPQVAAWGEHHLRVAKTQTDSDTSLTATPLDAKARIEELARMLAGDKITPASRRNAKALLKAAG